ncbi:MAG TPA: sugar transferase [Abditibacterium sp.]|jgi:exopolysaccharide biosynthesis polyprenyl glycosylphosphotransferase
MLKAQRTSSIALMMALDALALILAFAFTWWVRGNLGEVLVALGKSLHFDTSNWVRRISEVPRGEYDIIKVTLSPNPLVNISKHLWVLYFSLLSWGTLLHFQKGYDLSARRTARQEFAVCAYSGLLGTVSLLAFMGLLQWTTSRLFIVGLLIFGVLSVWGTRRVVLPLAQKRGAKPRRHVLMIGPASAATRFAQMLATPAYQWSQLIGYVSDEKFAANTVKHLGQIVDLPRILDDEIIDEVILVRAASESDKGVNWGQVLELCLERGRTVSLVDDIAPPAGAKVEASMMGQMPVLVLHNTPQNPLALGIKNVMDRVLAAFMLVLLAPMFCVIAVLIKMHDGGPVFYNQDRVGLNGRIFKFYKFRSMDVNASEILEKMKRENRAYYDSINTMQEPFFKAPDDKDPRITPIGRFIRKTSIDELPQFWNVLKGDMSLVGPRPPLPKEVAELAPWHRRKLSVKGGLTCIWQASGRNNVAEVDEWMKMDLEYIDNWSLWLDVKLMFQTVRSVIKRDGAS